MSITANSGPYISFGQSTYADYNPELAPSLFWGGAGILDPRAPFTYVPGQDFGAATAGFLGSTAITTYDYNPTVASVTAVAGAYTPSTTAAVNTLVSSNSATTGVAVSQSITRQDTGATVTGLLALDACTQVTGYISNGTSGTAGNILIVSTASAALLSAGMLITGTGISSGTNVVGAGPVLNVSNGNPGAGFTGTYLIDGAPVAAGTSGSPITITATISGSGQDGIVNSRLGFGSANTIQMWNPQALSARNVTVNPTTAAGTVIWTVAGYDVYGYPMTETITTAAGSTAVAGKKAFKYIASITPNTTDTGSFTFGTGTVFGFALRSDTFGDVIINYAAASQNPALITANTGYVAAVKTYATSATGDVRGTYSATAAVANRFVFKQSPPLYNVGSTVGLFGVTQA